MTEKLYRHIAEMWAVRSDDECLYEYCVFCDATVESTIADDDGNLIDQEVEHAPGCWYVWCCEWVEKHSRYPGNVRIERAEMIAIVQEYVDKKYPWDAMVLSVEYREVDGGCWIAFLSIKQGEQNTGDEPV
jgi:hypothetical protein